MVSSACFPFLTPRGDQSPDVGSQSSILPTPLCERAEDQIKCFYLCFFFPLFFFSTNASLAIQYSEALWTRDLYSKMGRLLSCMCGIWHCKGEAVFWGQCCHMRVLIHEGKISVETAQIPKHGVKTASTLFLLHTLSCAVVMYKFGKTAFRARLAHFL